MTDLNNTLATVLFIVLIVGTPICFGIFFHYQRKAYERLVHSLRTREEEAHLNAGGRRVDPNLGPCGEEPLTDWQINGLDRG